MTALITLCDYRVTVCILFYNPLLQCNVIPILLLSKPSRNLGTSLPRGDWVVNLCPGLHSFLIREIGVQGPLHQTRLLQIMIISFYGYHLKLLVSFLVSPFSSNCCKLLCNVLMEIDTDKPLSGGINQVLPCKCCTLYLTADHKTYCSYQGTCHSTGCEIRIFF